MAVVCKMESDLSASLSYLTSIFSQNWNKWTPARFQTNRTEEDFNKIKLRERGRNAKESKSTRLNIVKRHDALVAFITGNREYPSRFKVLFVCLFVCHVRDCGSLAIRM